MIVFVGRSTIDLITSVGVSLDLVPQAEEPPTSGDLKMHVTFRYRNCRDRDLLRVQVDVDLFCH
jgi:hypothetical protein